MLRAKLLWKRERERESKRHISRPTHFSMSCTSWDWTKQNRAKWPVILRCRSNYHHVYLHIYLYMFLYASWSQWPRCRRCEFTYTLLLGLRVRIPTGTFTPISFKCCVLSGRVLFLGLIIPPEKFYRVWCVWMWSWSVDNEETLDQLELLCHDKKTKNLILKLTKRSAVRSLRVLATDSCSNK